jgi:hypothetical protein
MPITRPTGDKSVTTNLLDVAILVLDCRVVGLDTREPTGDVAVVDGDDGVLRDVLGLAGPRVVVGDVCVGVVGCEEVLAC